MPGITVAAARTRPRRATESAAAQQRSHLGGCILWLPERNGRAVTPDYDGGDHDNGSGTLTAGCYNHPVVIISAGARRGKVTILIVSSPSPPLMLIHRLRIALYYTDNLPMS